MSEPSLARQTRVLLSFSSAYSHLAQQLATDLKSANIQVVYDKWEGGGGAPATESIENSLDDITFLLPLLTPSEATPIWVGEEWKQKFFDPARNRNINVLPVLGADCKPPEFLEDLSYANLFNQNYALEFQRLVQTIYHRSGDTSIKLPATEDISNESPSPLTLPSKRILIEVGEDLASLFEDENGKPFFIEKVPMMRDGLFYELGVKFPKVNVQVKTNLPPLTAQVLLNDFPESEVEIPLNTVMVNATVEQMVKHGFTAEPATNPASGASCAWIPSAQIRAAAESGLTIWNSHDFLILWLGSVLRRKAADFIGIEEVQGMLKQIEPVFPQLIAETVPKTVSAFLLTDILRRLVVESVSIRNLPGILMSLAEWGRVESDPLFLTEYARAALKRQISHKLSRGTKQLVIFLLDPDIESPIRESLRHTPTGSYVDLESDQLRKILEVIQNAMRAIPNNVQVPQILTTMEIRAAIRRLVALSIPQLYVVSYQELMPDYNIQPVGRISVNKGTSWRSSARVGGVPLGNI